MGHISENVTLDNPAFIHESAWLYGKVTIGPGASVWPNVVTRAETYEIRIGARTNIQDFVMIHVGAASPTIVGEDCSITHHATLHGCTIGDRCLIGINATIMDGAKIGNNCIVAGHTIVTEGSEFPDNTIIAGVPGKAVAMRDCGDANLVNARFYSAMAESYANGEDRLSKEKVDEVLAKLNRSVSLGLRLRLLEYLLELRHRPAIENQLKARLLEQGFCLSRTASASAVHNDFLIEFDTHVEQGAWQALEPSRVMKLRCVAGHCGFDG